MQLRLVGEGVGEQFATKFGPPPPPPRRPQSNISGSAPAFAGNIKRVYKRAEYSFHQLIRLGRLEIHIALSAQHRCRNPR